ncbi:hypothetical protein AMTR_s00141p00100970, partial [Amborella trichopoda]
DEATPKKGAKQKGTKKKKDVESPEPSLVAELEVHRKSTRLRKRALSSLDASPSIHFASSEATDLTSKPKKHAKTKASPSPTLPSEVAAPIQETIPKVVTTQPVHLKEIFLKLILKQSKAPLDIEATASKVPTPTTLEEEPQSQPDASLSKTLKLVVVPPPEVPISAVPNVELPSKANTLSMSNIVLNRKALLAKRFLQSSLQRLKECSLSDLAAEIIAVRDRVTALNNVSYEKKTFD